MKTRTFYSLLAAILMLALSNAATSQAPARQFLVRNSPDVTVSGTAYPASVILYKDAAAKTAAIEYFAIAYGYQAVLEGGAPNPETKLQFFHRMISNHIRDTIKGVRVSQKARAAAEAENAAADNELPN